MWHSSHTKITCYTWHSSQTKSHALHVTLLTNQITRVTCDTRHKPNHMRYVTLVTTRPMLHITDQDAMFHAESPRLSEFRDMQWRYIVQRATVAGRWHHWQFSSQVLPHWAHCKDRMLSVRPQTDCSAQRRTHVMAQVVSRRSFLVEAWVRFQLSFYGNRGNHSSNGVLPSCARSVPSMLYRIILALLPLH
jgi:hypothetical protein